MFGQLLQNSPLIAFPIVGLGLFLMSFATIVVRTLSRRAEDYRAASELPLEGGTRVDSSH
jgi:hypothetical protein